MILKIVHSLKVWKNPNCKTAWFCLFVSFFFLTTDSICLEVIQWLEVIPIFNFFFSFPLTQSIPLSLEMCQFLLSPNLLAASVVMSPFLFLILLFLCALSVFFLIHCTRGLSLLLVVPRTNYWLCWFSLLYLCFLFYSFLLLYVLSSCFYIFLVCFAVPFIISEMDCLAD